LLLLHGKRARDSWLNSSAFHRRYRPQPQKCFRRCIPCSFGSTVSAVGRFHRPHKRRTIWGQKRLICRGNIAKRVSHPLPNSMSRLHFCLMR
jgi:hypothetical protein